MSLGLPNGSAKVAGTIGSSMEKVSLWPLLVPFEPEDPSSYSKHL